MKILLINGPNLNLLGKREINIYGKQTFDEIFNGLQQQFPAMELSYQQSNIEGELVNLIQEADGQIDGIILNAAAYTHTSIAIADAIAAISVPVVEVHLSNLLVREVERHTSLIAKNCVGSISGFGFLSYQLAIQYFESAKI
jgi:3-dehydroquinate dehydratase-2